MGKFKTSYHGQLFGYLQILDDMPNVVLVGDVNECFVLQSNVLIPYLDNDEVDWSVAPSEAYSRFPRMVAEISQDESINPFVYVVNEGFSFQQVYELGFFKEISVECVE